MTRKLFVTTALPYANAAFHIGHMMEYIQADIWVRYQRMQNSEVHFVCADDTHGTPIMIAAEKEGITPQEFVAKIAAGRAQYLDGFHIKFDNWYSTDSPENVELSQGIYRKLRDAGLITTKSSTAFMTPSKACSWPTAISRANARTAAPRINMATIAKSAVRRTSRRNWSIHFPCSLAPSR